MNMFNLIRCKFTGIFHRLLDYLGQLPTRSKQLLRHCWSGINRLVEEMRQFRIISILRSIARWWLYFLFYLLDLIGLPEVYETLTDLIKFNSRPLRPWEIELAKSVFANTINYQRVRIDEYSFAGPPQGRFCYVSFYTINSWGPMQNSIFIHEMTHIWQFAQLGSVYIPKALIAQQSIPGYNYGGAEALWAGRETGKSFLSFNFEQQGDIISDYFRLREGYTPRWGPATTTDLPVYEAYLAEVRQPKAKTLS